MAYFNKLASVHEADVGRLQSDPEAMLHPSKVSGASHLIAYWVQAQPLGGLLARALDGGEVIRPELWHPLRPPCYHVPLVVRDLALGIEAEVQAGVVAEDQWLAAEVGRVLDLFRHAAQAGECVVSVLNGPADAERAGRVQPLWRVP